MCSGEGQTAEKRCGKCNGHKRHAKSQEVVVNIPAGIKEGSSIRLKGMGSQGVNMSDGDLYVNIVIEESKKFIRKGYDIYSKLNISVPQAGLGDELEVVTVHGLEYLVIPPGSNHGKEITLKGLGVPFINSKEQRGNHIIVLSVDIPKKISKTERALYLDIAKESGLDIKPGKAGLLW